MFIAVVGMPQVPVCSRFKEVGFSLFIIGALATAIPLLSGLLMGKYLFKFHPALTLGCTAGARTTTAALGAVQDAVESEIPGFRIYRNVCCRQHTADYLGSIYRIADVNVKPILLTTYLLF